MSCFQPYFHFVFDWKKEDPCQFLYVHGEFDELTKLHDSLDLIVQEEEWITSFYLEWKKLKHWH